MYVQVSARSGIWPAFMALRYFLIMRAYYFPFIAAEPPNFIYLSELRMYLRREIVCETNYGLSYSTGTRSSAWSFCSSMSGFMSVKHSLFENAWVMIFLSCIFWLSLRCCVVRASSR